MDRRQLLKCAGLVLGGLASPSFSRTLLVAKNSPRIPNEPFFKPAARKQVEYLAELVIPSTDTPGAIAAGVPDFIELMVAQWYSETERQVFLQGLEALEGWCQDKHGRSFVDCDDAQRTEALKWSEQQAAAHEGGPPASLHDRHRIDEHAPFFTKLKELVVVGYYTSEVGARQEHRLFIMTPHFDGDFDLSRVDGRQWSY